MFLMQCLDSEDKPLLGSGKGSQVLFQDLQTLRGVINRITRLGLNANTKYRIIQFNSISFSYRVTKEFIPLFVNRNL